MKVPYSGRFYTNYADESFRSARAVVPQVIRLLDPRSVVDVGCGVGAWLAAFRENGVDDILGLDGDYVPRDRLRMPAERFIPADVTARLPVDRTFDLACSVEVAEHLPASKADAFVGELARLAPAVLFSAAIPFQGGTDHINEQWPEYWAAKFRAHGRLPVDCLRARLWHDENVAYYYAQNLLLFVREDIARNRGLTPLDEVVPGMVHPVRWMEQNDPARRYTVLRDIRRELARITQAFPAALRNALWHRLGKGR